MLLLVCSLPSAAQYHADLLGGDYEARTFRYTLRGGDSTRCTLIRKPLQEGTTDALLYLHGYNDYFFQTALGDSATAHGMNFYALDLHGYGRSLQPGDEAFYCRDLQEYFCDLDTALSTLRAEGNRRVILMGHSTGGLIAAYYLHKRQDENNVSLIKGLILNSPFLDWNLSPFLENFLVPVVASLGRLFPHWKVLDGQHSFYADALLADKKGEWNFNTDWKKPEGYPIRAGWLRAIHRAQRELQRGTELTCPVLVLSSDSSAREEGQWQEDFRRKDIVLDVEDIHRYGLRLGKNVEYLPIPGGMHDLALSSRPVREEFYRACFGWISRLLHTGSPTSGAPAAKDEVGNAVPLAGKGIPSYYLRSCVTFRKAPALSLKK